MLNRRILIVDDNADIHNDFKKILAPKVYERGAALSSLENELFGAADAQTDGKDIECVYEIDSASQGQQALEMVEAAAKQGKPYALVFMDVRMPPGWDGIETTRRIWQKFPFTEVVLCTAYTDYSIDDMIRILGFTHRLLMITKPFGALAVKQMALAITAKWNFENETRNQVATLEERVRERTRELEEATSKFVQAGKMAALGEMAGGVAHEINNPLAIIKTYAEQLRELLQDNPIDLPMVTRNATQIDTTVDRIAKIVSGLRTFSRDATRDQYEEVSVSHIIEETSALCGERFKNRGVTLTIEPFPVMSVECRPTQISQVLLNLLNNAYDAIEPLAARWIKINVADRGDKVEIRVTDSGGGIPKQVAEKLFQPFFTTKPVGSGVGIGLSISKGIVDAHRGSLGVDAGAKNTCFVLTLPKIQVSTKETRTSAAG